MCLCVESAVTSSCNVVGKVLKAGTLSSIKAQNAGEKACKLGTAKLLASHRVHYLTVLLLKIAGMGG